MKTYGFTTAAGWIGGSGVVVAKDKETALVIVNKQGNIEAMKFQILLGDLIEIKPGTVFILSNGDY